MNLVPSHNVPRAPLIGRAPGKLRRPKGFTLDAVTQPTDFRDYQGGSRVPDQITRFQPGTRQGDAAQSLLRALRAREPRQQRRRWRRPLLHVQRRHSRAECTATSQCGSRSPPPGVWKRVKGDARSTSAYLRIRAVQFWTSTARGFSLVGAAVRVNRNRPSGATS